METRFNNVLRVEANKEGLMNIIISSSKIKNNEHEIINSLFAEGLDYYHIRKPSSEKSKIAELISKVNPKYHHRLVLHSSFELLNEFNLGGINVSYENNSSFIYRWFVINKWKRKFPNLVISTTFSSTKDLLKKNNTYSYVFLSPVFAKFSYLHSMLTFNKAKLETALEESEYKVIALGGININTVQQSNDLGFAGICMQSCIWEAADPVKAFKEMEVISCLKRNKKEEAFRVKSA